MRGLICFILLELSVAISLYGQSRVKLGIRNGIVQSHLETTSFSTYGLNNYKSVYAYSGGLLAQYAEHRYWNLLTSLTYLPKGGVRKYEDAYIRINERWIVDCMSLDTQLKGKLDLNNFTPSLTIGPKVDYVISYNSYFKDLENQEVKINRYSYGMRGGIGLGYQFNKISFSVDWLLNKNFNRIIDSKGHRYFNRFTFDDQTMALYVTTMIKL